MTKGFVKKTLYAILLLALLCGAGVLSACSKAKSLEEMGYTVVVKYHYAGGTAGVKTESTLQYKPGTPFAEPGCSDVFPEPVLDKFHVVKGYFYAETDSEGNVITENGIPLASGRQVVFGTDRAEDGQTYTLVAVWEKLATVTIDVAGEAFSVKGYSIGSTVNRPTSYLDPKREGFTFYDYYSDPTCETKQAWPIEINESVTEITVYTKWLEGEWLILREKADLAKIKSNVGPASKIYLDNDIDAAETNGESGSWTQIDSFAGRFEGNGHTIRNLNCQIRQTMSINYGMFGELKVGAEIKGLYLQNVKLELTLNANRIFNVGLLAGRVSGNAAVELETKDCLVVITRVGAGVSPYPNYGQDKNYEGVVGNVTEGVSFSFSGFKVSVQDSDFKG